MKFFRYFGLDEDKKDNEPYVYKTLRDGELHLSRITKFNDSFEALCRKKSLSEADITKCQKYLSALQERLDKKIEELNASSQSGVEEMEEYQKKSIAISNAIKSSDIIENTREFDKMHSLDLQEMFDEKIPLRISCFTKYESESSADDIPLWAYYADGHEGIRLGFNFDENCAAYSLTPVIYQDEQIEIDIMQFYIDRAELPKASQSSLYIPYIEKDTETFLNNWQSQLSQLVTTKCKAWEHEKEVRLIATLKRVQHNPNQYTIKADGEYFFKLSPDNVWTVDFGLRFSDEKLKQKITAVMKEKYPDVQVRQAKLDDTKYALKYEER